MWSMRICGERIKLFILTSAYAVTHSLACRYDTNKLLYSSLLPKRYLLLAMNALNSNSCQSK